jgi:two-component system, OmpR family, copper resistance phosphate regulon response regulator CusR
MRLLVVEDNPKMAGFISQGLRELGYSVDVAASGRAGEAQAAEGGYDLIILDVMLPDIDGIEVCRNLRRRDIKSLILMLTALSTTADKITGLNAGADDYLTKPFEFDELIARVQAMLRRGESRESSLLRCADVEMDLLARKVTRAGGKFKLSNKEFALLEYFMRNPGKVLTRTAIAANVWDMGLSMESNVIDVYVGLLRRKIDKDFEKKLIHTVVGVGYIMSEEDPGV